MIIRYIIRYICNTHMHTHIHTRASTHVSICLHICIYICIYRSMHMHIHVQMHKRIRLRIPINTRKHMNIYECTQQLRVVSKHFCCFVASSAVNGIYFYTANMMGETLSRRCHFLWHLSYQNITSTMCKYGIYILANGFECE